VTGARSVPVRTTHLELRSPEAFRPKGTDPDNVLMLRVGRPSPEFSRFLYTAVGGDWNWSDRLTWTYADWMAWLDRPGVETWVLYQDGTPAGYFELEAQDAGSVEITYLGLLPERAGAGLGGYLLGQAVQRAFRARPAVRRVWLHTCTLDAPAALANYLARGFTVFKEEETIMRLDNHAPGPWPGAERPR
jgi:ribosomal protein S18 acetylase RimI-like enzyme